MEEEKFKGLFPSIKERNPRFIKDGGQERITPGPKLSLVNFLNQPGAGPINQPADTAL